ncbi:MAG: family 16 glycoside hydrolase [Nannocystaceae bacterium]
MPVHISGSPIWLVLAIVTCVAPSSGQRSLPESRQRSTAGAAEVEGKSDGSGSGEGRGATPAGGEGESEGESESESESQGRGWNRLVPLATGPLPWRVEGDASFTAEGGVVVGSGVEGAGGLVSEQRWGDFDLRFEFRLSEGGQGGVAVRVGEGGGGYRYALDSSARAYTGGVYAPDRARWLMPLDRNFAAREAVLPGMWNEGRIEVIGPRVRTWINAVPASEVFDPDRLSGRVALSVAPGSGTIAWKNIRLKSIGQRRWIPLLREGSLTGWDRLGQAVWSWEQDTLHVTRRVRGAGNASLLTRRRFRDFVLRMEVKAFDGPVQLLLRSPDQGGTGRPALQCALSLRNLGRLCPPGLACTDLEVAAAVSADDVGGWHTLAIVAVQGRVLSFVDGEPRSDLFLDHDPDEGRIGLLASGALSKTGLVRNLVIANLTPDHDAAPAWRRTLARADPLPPADAVATLRVAPGFGVERVAAEPLVFDPIDLAWDRDGGLWVLEASETGEGSAGRDRAPGAVVKLDDADGDGVMDSRRVVLDGLKNSVGMAFVGGGLLVADPPSLWFCPTAESRLDCRGRRRVAWFGPRDGQSRDDPLEPDSGPRGLVWALDNWLYSASWSRRYRYRDGRLRGGDTSSTHGFGGGLATDQWGRVYSSAARQLLAVDLVSPAYMRRSPAVLGSELVGSATQVPLMRSGEPLFPVRPNASVPGGALSGSLTRDGRLAHAVAVAGIEVYGGDQFPAALRGHAFVAEPGANAVVHISLTPRGIGLVAEHRVYDDPSWGKREFLVSSDERFRPVDVATGPDGALYVADLYRGLVQRSGPLSDYLRDEADGRGLREQHRAGRVYRIVARGVERRRQSPAFGEASIDELIGALSHSNAWWRHRAQQLLVAAPGFRPTRRLREADNLSAIARLHVLWALRGRRALNEAIVMEALGDKDPMVRVAGLQNADPFLWGRVDPSLRAAVERLRVDPDPRVGLQLVLTLGELGDDARARDTIAQLLARDCEDATLRVAALTSVVGHEAEMLTRVLGDAVWGELWPGRYAFVAALARLATLGWISGAIDAPPRRSGLEMFLAQIHALDGPGSYGWQKRAVLEGMASLAERSDARPVALTTRPLLFMGEKGGASLDAARSLFTWPREADSSQEGRAPKVLVGPI